MQPNPRRLTRQDLRLASGLTLFAYVAAHFANHALGLISIAAAERGLRIAVAVWRNLPGTVLLYGAALIHIALAFVALYERRTLCRLKVMTIDGPSTLRPAPGAVARPTADDSLLFH